MEELTKRESQIAERIAWGASEKEVADELRISFKTVDNTIQHLKRKINAQKNTEISVWYFCTHFKISFQLSPLKRKFMATMLLIVFLIGEAQENMVFAARRCGRERERIETRARLRDKDIDF